jgi:hypothetical protein
MLTEGLDVDFYQRYRRNPDFVHRHVGDEEILVPVSRSGSDLSSIYLLNSVGSSVWHQLSEPKTGHQLLDAIEQEFEVDRETAEADLTVFLEELESVAAVAGESIL